MRIDVLPEPVGPTIRLILSLANWRLSSTLRTNFLLDGVKEPSVSADQVNEAAWNPILSGCLDEATVGKARNSCSLTV